MPFQPIRKSLSDVERMGNTMRLKDQRIKVNALILRDAVLTNVLIPSNFDEGYVYDRKNHVCYLVIFFNHEWVMQAIPPEQKPIFSLN